MVFLGVNKDEARDEKRTKETKSQAYFDKRITEKRDTFLEFERQFGKGRQCLGDLSADENGRTISEPGGEIG
jgi:hypothetical protein